MARHLFRVTISTGISVNPVWRQGTAKDTAKIGRRIKRGLASAIIGKADERVRFDHVDKVTVVKIGAGGGKRAAARKTTKKK
jgi:hypothetical protein